MEEKLSELERRVEALTRRSRRLMWGMGAALAVAVVAILAALWPVREFAVVRARSFELMDDTEVMRGRWFITPETGAGLTMYRDGKMSVGVSTGAGEEGPIFALDHSDGQTAVGFDVNPNGDVMGYLSNRNTSATIFATVKENASGGIEITGDGPQIGFYVRPKSHPDSADIRINYGNAQIKLVADEADGPQIIGHRDSGVRSFRLP